MSFELQFLGAAGTVTGSKYLLTLDHRKILVDCGLFQGLKALRLKNWEPLSINPSEIDAVVLTHAHIDHSGYIPRLIRDGFKGKIYSTHATRDLCRILLPDCGYLQEEEAAYLNRIKKTKHTPALPLFTYQEAIESIKYFEPVGFDSIKQIFDNIKIEFRYVGHILGAASVILHFGEQTIAFTGDIGRLSDPILHTPALLPNIDYLVTESTYGDRLHSESNALNDLEKIIKDTVLHNGVILIPAFAVGRAMSLMHFLSILSKENRIPKIPMYLNSPMATDFSEVFFQYRELHKLSDEQCRDISRNIKHVQNTDESIELNKKRGPMLIISASGMITGGRILHHLKAFGSDPNNTIILTGFQSAGTRGESLLKGAKDLKIHGEYVPINAKVVSLENISAHADYAEIIEWFKQSKIKPKKVFITHGEPAAADSLRLRLTDTFGWPCIVPDISFKIKLD